MSFPQKAQRGIILIAGGIILSFLLVTPSVNGWMDDDPISPMNGMINSPLKPSTISYTPHVPIVIDDNANFSNQANTEGWLGDGSERNPYVIEGLSITGSDDSDLLVISNTDVHFQIRNCLFTEGSIGIRLDNAQNGYIINNTVTNNDGSGIHLENSGHITLVNNTVANNGYAGIMHFDSYHITLSGNRVAHNSVWGIDFNDSWNNSVIGNMITQCSSFGIALTRSDSNTITNNTLTSNQGAGIWIHMNSDNNRVHFNNLLSNYGRQAHDDNSGNVFSYNYWDDWTSPDTNDDGIVDEPYPIEGDANNQDPFPLIFPSGIENLDSWFDNFDKSTLDDLWIWNPIDSAYSLTNSPGWFVMDVASDENTWFSIWGSPMLYHPAPEGDWYIETFMQTNAGVKSQTGLLFFENTSRWYVWGFVYDNESDNHNTPGVGLEGIEDGGYLEEFLFTSIPSTEWDVGIYLKIEFIASNNLFIFSYRKTGDLNYTIGGNRTLDWSNLQLGLWGKSWGEERNPGYSSKFDYVSVNTNDIDSDNDAIPNWYENLYGLDSYLDDAGEDFDHDGLTNFEEFQLNTKASDPDSDGDGLNDGDEVKSYNTNPINSDSDADNIPDGWEIYNNLNPLSNDANEDPDTDNLSNLDEYLHGTNPTNADSDVDGLPDGWEVRWGFNPLINDANTDSDIDILTTFDEYLYGTNPHSIDSDDDGLIDGDEVQTYLTDPTDADSDDDWLTDGQEVLKYTTDPLKSDSDVDGLTDGEEVLTYITDPLESDSDNDGLTDGEEVNKYNTDPNDSDSDDDFFSDRLDHGLLGDPRTPWDNPVTRGLLLILLLGFLGLGVWSGYIAIALPKLQKDLKLLFQQFQQYVQQFQEDVTVTKNQENLDEMEAAADQVYNIFQSYQGFYLFAQEFVNRKWLPSFLRPDLAAWETIFETMKQTFEDFQQIRLKRLDAKY
ncbi:MAG: right-handed parallel beta-helix repeat-containing protein [Promethearchaeota archaeon]